MVLNSPKLKVIIADSSNYSRLVLSNMVQAQPDLEVLDTAADGLALMASLRRHRPDVVLADFGQPEDSHFMFLRRMHQETGVPVLMLFDQESKPASNLGFAGLGVYDYILKPAHKLQPKLREVQGEILDKIRAVRKPKFVSTFSYPASAFLVPKKEFIPEKPKAVIVIGASTGGTQAIEKIVSGLDEKLDACVLIAVHLPAGFTRSFAKRLQTLTPLKVVEGKLGTRLLKGKIIIAPGGKNMIVLPEIGKQDSFKINFEAGAADEFNRPSVDMLMKSVAKHCGPKSLGIVLTGMGKDGTEGMEALQKAGGLTLAQDQASSVIFGMAKSAIDNGHVSYVRSLMRIPAFINKFAAELPVAGLALHKGN
ncbi:chemotaxis protein CheB [Adhaeribacter soli]|uniref:protein-glutamate methylesterase n=1 Tax=Adhaeribacter soli TaxID=2607655 RepID=A0A5N1J5R2_9BACT|nr:chemotaxis protein CheB [Adhaeribacter soli]KAA9346044.1 response regulator [Adhaeribacter soli]